MELGDDDFRWTRYLEKIVEQGKKREEENEFTLYSRAVQAQEAKNLKEALRLYNKVEKYTTRFTWVYYNRAVIRSDLGDKKGAIDDYNKAIEVNPRLYQAYSNRGLA
jgi:tetratricopeptide (TPR) repeat protein